MRKIRLNLDALAVESFSTTGDREKSPGTVHAHDATILMGCVSGDSDCATCQPFGCPADTQTCFASCGRTNGYQVCFGTCLVDCAEN
jgi:hypothetical protein